MESLNSWRYKLGTDFPGHLLSVFFSLSHRKHLSRCLIFQSLSVVKVFPVQFTPQPHIPLKALPYLLGLWLKRCAESRGWGLRSQEAPAPAHWSELMACSLPFAQSIVVSSAHTHTHIRAHAHMRTCILGFFKLKILNPALPLHLMVHMDFL